MKGQMQNWYSTETSNVLRCSVCSLFCACAVGLTGAVQDNKQVVLLNTALN